MPTGNDRLGPLIMVLKNSFEIYHIYKRINVYYIFHKLINMFDFFYKPRFYFINSYILSIFSESYFTLVYPRNFLVSPALDRPVLYYDLKFRFYILSLIRGEKKFFFFKPYTFFYFFFVGLFLRILWVLGAGYRFFPVYSRFDDVRVVGFYDLGFTPLAILFRFFYYLKAFFYGFSALHYTFNPYFFFYSHVGWKRPTNILLNAHDDLFLNKVLTFSRFFKIFSLIFFSFLGFFFSFFLHFFGRPFLWYMLLLVGRFWSTYVSVVSSPVFSFERLWLSVQPNLFYLNPGSLTSFFSNGLSAYRLHKSLQLLGLFGLVKPGLYHKRSSFHYFYSANKAQHGVFKVFKFQFVRPLPSYLVLDTIAFSTPSPSRLSGISNLQKLTSNFFAVGAGAAEKQTLFFVALRRRSALLMSSQAAVVNIFFSSVFYFLGTFFFFFLVLIRIFVAVFFGPIIDSRINLISRLVAYFSNYFYFPNLLSFFANGRSFFSFFIPLSYFRLRYLTAFFSDIFTPVFVRAQLYTKLYVEYSYFNRLKKLFRKLNYYTIYSSYFHDHDLEVLSSHQSTLDSADIDPHDIYDTDLAEGDTLDISFPNEDFLAQASAVPFNFLHNQNSASYDSAISQDFFQPGGDMYAIEANLNKVFLAQILIPNFYEFYRRQQYKHIEEEFWFYNHEWHENPHYENEDLPTDYETSSPDSLTASRLVTWGNNYRHKLNQWQKARTVHPFQGDFVRGSGIVLGAQQLDKLSKADWLELTLFVESISTNASQARSLSKPLTAHTCREIWRVFDSHCQSAPDLMFRRILSSKQIPKAFENIFVYPRGDSYLYGRFIVSLAKFLFGSNFSNHKIFKNFIKIFIGIGLFDERHFEPLAGGTELLSSLTLYFQGYVSAAEFSRTSSSIPKTRYQILLASAYLRQTALDDFETFRVKAQGLKNPALISILWYHQKYKGAFLESQPNFKESSSLTFFQAFAAILREPNIVTFSDYFYRFWVRRPQPYILDTLTGDERLGERLKIEPAHPLASLTPYLFITDFFRRLFPNYNSENLFSSQWFSKNDLPPAVGPFPRADDPSTYSPELRAPAHVINPYPNEVEGWLGLTPFLSFLQDSFYDPQLIDLALPSQLSWLGLEDTYRWDVEADLEQLDIYDEYMDVTTEYWLDDDEDVAPNGPFEGQVNEDDIDSLSMDPDATEIGYDIMGEAATYEDLHESAEEPWDNEYASDTHMAYYAIDQEELTVENYGEDDWALEEFNLFTDASIPLSRLFFGGLRHSQAFAATDPRIFLGTFAEAPRDTSLHFSSNFEHARRNAETLVPAVSSPLPLRPNRVLTNLFFRQPLVSATLKIFIYLYFFLKDLVYVYIFFDFQSRADVLKIKLHFRALNHYFRWSSFYGNKYYFSKFSGALSSWLSDFENYTNAKNRAEGVAGYKLFSYFKPYAGTARLRVLSRFLDSLPLVSFWHSGVNQSVTDDDYSTETKPNYDHVDKWSLYERQRFTALLDLPTYGAIGDKYADEVEGSFLDLAPHVDDDDFSGYDDALLFNFSVEEDVRARHEEFTNKIELLYAACIDFFDLVRDYTLYSSRLLINYYFIGPFQYWVLFSDTFWLKLAIRLGFWVNVLRYFLAVSIYIVLVTYVILVLPRFVYYLLGDYFSTSILLFINGLVSAIVILVLGFIIINPAYHFFKSFTKFERTALFYLLFFIYSQHSFYGYLRVGVPNVARLDTMDSHADTQRIRRELNNDMALERSHAYHNKGIAAHKNLETVGEYVPMDMERIVFDARSRQKMNWRGSKGWSDATKRNQHFEFSYSSAPFGFTNFFYAIKSNVLKIRTRAFTGYRYIRQYRLRTIDIAQQNELHPMVHRYESFNTGTTHKRAQEWMLERNIQRNLDGFQTGPLRITRKVLGGVGRRSTRTARKNYFSFRHHNYLTHAWTPFAYDFRVKSLDHNPEVYGANLAFTKKFDFSYNRFGQSPRQRNEIVRVPIWGEFFGPDDDDDAGEEELELSEEQWSKLSEEQRSALELKEKEKEEEEEEEDSDLFDSRPRFDKRDKSVLESYRNIDADDVLGDAALDISVFSPRGKEPETEAEAEAEAGADFFYNKNFNVYGYGDWRHRRVLLNKAYTFKRFSSSSFSDLGQYYYFIRARAKNAHFSDLYAKNLRDYVLQSKPSKAYAIADVYGPTVESEQLAKLINGSTLFYQQDRHGLNALSRNRPYKTPYNNFARIYPGSQYASKDQSDTYYRLQKYFNKKSDQPTWYHPLHFYTTELYFKLFGSQTHTPRKTIFSKTERAQFLAIARALRSIRQHNRLLHMTKNFSDFHFYKSMIPTTQYPRDALSLYLAFENSRAPVTVRTTHRPTLDPFYQTYANSPNVFPDAFASQPLPKALNAHTGYTLLPDYAPQTKHEFDPAVLYDLPEDYPWYNFPGTGSTDTDLRFSFIFDNFDVYDDESQEEFEAFNRSPELDEFPAAGVADYEDYLDDYLQRRPYPKFFMSPGAESDLFGQLAFRSRFAYSIDMYEKLPQIYDPFKIRKYKDVRSARRFSPRKANFIVGERRKHRPGRRMFKGRARRFSSFANQLAAVSDYNRVKSLNQVYFSEFKRFAEISSPHAIIEFEINNAIRVPPRRKENLFSFFNDDDHYKGRWSLNQRPFDSDEESASLDDASSRDTMVDDFDEIEPLDDGAAFRLLRKQAARKAAIMNEGIYDFQAATLMRIDGRPVVAEDQSGQSMDSVEVDLEGNLDNIIAIRERKRYEARLARERLQNKPKDL